MSNLRHLQENFQTYLLGESEDFVDEVIASNTAIPQERLNVYHEAYYLRLIGILGADFPILKKLIGEDKFNEIAHQYIEAFPSNHFSARYFSRHFCKFLANYHPATETLDGEVGIIVWIEMAKFEEALSNALDAKDAPYLTLEIMAAVAPELWSHMHLIPHPSLSAVSLFYNIPDIWQAFIHNKAMPELKRTQEANVWLLWRKDQHPYYCPTTFDEAWIIQAIQQDKDFSQICEGLCDWIEETQVAQVAANALRQWIADGVFSEVITQS